jgi:hypothetical protein
MAINSARKRARPSNLVPTMGTSNDDAPILGKSVSEWTLLLPPDRQFLPCIAGNSADPDLTQMALYPNCRQYLKVVAYRSVALQPGSIS